MSGLHDWPLSLFLESARILLVGAGFGTSLLPEAEPCSEACRDRWGSIWKVNFLGLFGQEFSSLKAILGAHRVSLMKSEGLS